MKHRAVWSVDGSGVFAFTVPQVTKEVAFSLKLTDAYPSLRTSAIPRMSGAVAYIGEHLHCSRVRSIHRICENLVSSLHTLSTSCFVLLCCAWHTFAEQVVVRNTLLCADPVRNMHIVFISFFPLVTLKNRR